MSRYTGPKCRLSRREGLDLQLKSSKRSLESKCNIKVPPGQHGERASRNTDYRGQLRMKQAIKRYYGCLTETQFRNYYEKAERLKGSTGENLMRILESRLDNVVFRLGLASTRVEARQLVSHKSILVNGKAVNIPSYLVEPNDVIEIKDKSKAQERIKTALQLASQGTIPEWVERDGMKGIFKRYPDMSELPPDFKIHLVVEFYSK